MVRTVLFSPILVSEHDADHTGTYLNSTKFVALGAVMWRIFRWRGICVIFGIAAIKAVKGKLPILP